MLSALLQLAEQIVRGGSGGPEANQQFRNIISEVNNLTESLSLLGDSDIYCFVYCSNMIKLIESGQFSLVSETKSEENVLNLNENTNNVKLKAYSQIIGAMIELLLGPNKPSHIRKTQIDLAAICLKTLFEDSSHFPFLQRTISVFLPQYFLPENFNTTTETALQLIAPRSSLDISTLPQYATLLEIFISMFEYVTVQNATKTYYEYRRSIYVFRNSYLAYFLYFTVEHIKLLFLNYDHSSPMAALINLTIQLLQAVFMYPFTLSLHDYQVDDDSAENIAGSSAAGEIYFPNYFRHAICDVKFLQQLYSFLEMTIQNNSQSFQVKRNTLNSLVKILGRSVCGSQYTFKNDEEKQLSREFGVYFLEKLSSNYSYSDSYYLNIIMDIQYKLLVMYDFYFSSQRQRIINITISFLYQAIQNYQIKIEEGKKSPLARTFELLGIAIEYSKDKGEHQILVKERSQRILEKVYERVLNEGEKIMEQFGINQPTEIQCMSELFQSITPAFEVNLNENLMFFSQINIFSLSEGAATLWLHLCSQLLPKTTANREQTTIIIKYYELATKGDTLAKLRYIKTMAEEVMGEFFEGEPHTTLWTYMVQITGVDFKKFVLSILSVCTQNFENSNNQILDYSLQLFKTIYITLKKNDHQTFQEFYRIVNALLQNLENTIFSRPTHYHKRKDFFQVISLIWINSDAVNYIYEIYQLISSKINSGTPESFFQYLHDITGLVEPLDIHQAFEVLTELALEDLTKLFNMHFQDPKAVMMYFSNQMFMKIFCKLIFALISDINRKLFFQTHTKIPLRIYNLVSPIMMILAEGGYEYPNRFINILQKMAALHPLGQLVPFAQISKTLKQQSPDDFQKLIRVYFDHIDRVADITWLYELIENSADHMTSWWEEAMVRNMHPNVNFLTIAQSRFWTTARQKELFAKLLFELSYYDRNYWQVDPSLGERAFVEEFSKVYF